MACWRGGTTRMDALRDLDSLRGFFGGGVNFLFDAPWVPVYLAVIYLLHPILGHMAVGAAVVLFALALLNSYVTAKPLSAAGMAGRRAMRTAESALRNAEAVEAMDLMPGLIRRWEADHESQLGHQATVAVRTPCWSTRPSSCARWFRSRSWDWERGWSCGTSLQEAP